MKTLIVVLTIVAFLISAVFFQDKAPFVIQSIRNLGWLAPIFFILLYSLATILLLPTMVLTLAGGVLFGPLLGTFFNLIGATLGASCAFYISRHFASNWVHSQKGLKLNQLIQGVERRGWQFVALLRLIPVIPFNFVNYGLGITSIKYTHYLATTFLFSMPAEIIYTYCGYASMDALTQIRPFYQNLSLFSLLVLILLIFLYKLLSYYRRRGQNN